MNTTENISIAGYAFTIETEAYEELSAYIYEIRKGFEGNSGAEEICSDIEERIAELLNERCKSGTVVSSRMLREVMERIGNPSDLTGKEADNEEKVNRRQKGYGKKLYRDIDERVIGGVCSGLGNYFGIDKVIFRISFLVFFFIGLAEEGLFCLALVAYICLWIAMPAARTVEQKCEMKGRPIKLEGFHSKDFDFKREVKDLSKSPAVSRMKRIMSITIGLILLFCGLSGLLGCVFIPSLPDFIDRLLNMDNQHGEILKGWDLIAAGLITSSGFWKIIMVNLIIAFIGMLYGGIMLTFDLKSPSWKPGIVIFIAWFISSLAVAAWVIRFIADAMPGVMIW